MSSHPPNRADETAPDRPPSESARGVGFGATAVFLLVILAVVVGVVALA